MSRLAKRSHNILWEWC